MATRALDVAIPAARLSNILHLSCFTDNSVANSPWRPRHSLVLISGAV